MTALALELLVAKEIVRVPETPAEPLTFRCAMTRRPLRFQFAAPDTE
jgi:hypothetical protein